MLSLPVIFQDGLFSVHSDLVLTDAQKAKVSKELNDAWRYDLSELGWSPSGALGEPVNVAILSKEFMQAHSLKFGGMTFNGRQLIAVNDSVLKATTYGELYAHELTHLLNARQFASIHAGNLGWSPTWGEGLACHNGATYRIARYPQQFPGGKIPVDRYNVQLTGSDVEWVFSHPKEPDPTDEQSRQFWRLRYPVGTQFIEFVRTSLNGTGYPNALRQIGAILVDMSQTKAPLSQEFATQFGTSLEEAEQQFIAHIRRTENHPDERFSRSIFKQRQPSKHPAEPGEQLHE